MKYMIIAIITIIIISCTSYKGYQRNDLYGIINNIPERYCSIYEPNTYKLEVSRKSIFEDFIKRSYFRTFPLKFIKEKLENKSYFSKYSVIKIFENKVSISYYGNITYFKKELFYKKIWKIKLIKEINRKYLFDGDMDINYGVNVFYVDEDGKEVYHYYTVSNKSFEDTKIKNKIKIFMSESKLVNIKIKEKLDYDDIKKIILDIVKELNIHPENEYDIFKNDKDNTWVIIIDRKVKVVISCLSKKIIEVKEIHEGNFDLSGINISKTPKKFNCKNKE